MRTLMMIGFAVVAALMATSASALLSTWDTTSTGTGTISGNVLSVTVNGITLKARAYSTSASFAPNVPNAYATSTSTSANFAGYTTATNGADFTGINSVVKSAWQSASIATYTGGIGVSNSVNPDTVVPQHAIDNNGAMDVVVFELPKGTDWDSFKINWDQVDSDVQAWVGGDSLAAGYDFTGVCFVAGCASTKSLASLGFVEAPNTGGVATSPNGGAFVNVPLNTSETLSSDQTGRYLIMAGDLGLGSVTTGNDFFKISSVSATAGLKILPEPGSIALLGLGLAALGFSRRRAQLRAGRTQQTSE